MIHYFGYSSIPYNDLPIYNKLVVVMLSSLNTIAVNLFPMITGFLICERPSNGERPFKIWFEGFLYSIGLFAVGLVFNREKINAGNLAHIFLPFATHHYWYLTASIILYLLSPFFNHIINKMPRIVFKRLVIAAGIMITVFYASNPFMLTDVYLGHPHGIVWMSYLYFAGAAIRLFNPSKKLWEWAGILAFTGLFLLKWFNINSILNDRIKLTDQYALLPMILSVSVFVAVKDIKISNNNMTNILSKIASCSFGVYLIQEHCLIRSLYWELFDLSKYCDSPRMFIQMICAIILLWPLAFLGHNTIRLLYIKIGAYMYSAIEGAFLSKLMYEDNKS